MYVYTCISNSIFYLLIQVCLFLDFDFEQQMVICSYCYIFPGRDALLVTASPCRDGLVVSVSTSHAVNRRFAPWLGHSKDDDKQGTNCRKDRVACGTVYWDMYLKDLLGSITRVGYCIPIPDFYIVLHGLRC